MAQQSNGSIASPEHIIPPGEESDNENEDDWEEVAEQLPSAKCLFCTEFFPNGDKVFAHCRTAHGFDLGIVRSKHRMDFFSYVKMVNYVRKHSVPPQDVLAASQPAWNAEEYLQPVVPDDTLLMFDFEDDDIPSGGDTQPYSITNDNEGNSMSLSREHYNELLSSISTLTADNAAKATAISALNEDIRIMRASVQNFTGDVNIPTVVKARPVDEDHSYFSSYSHFGIHHEMLSDRIRTEAYRKALMDNKADIEGKVVLDLGCGTGILSLFAASCGASKVFGVDQSEIIYSAMDIVRENNMQDQVQLIKGRLEDTPLPQERVDIIVSEWMGYFLVFEGMLDSFLYARDHHLKEEGILMPNRCTISLVGCSDEERYSQTVGFWNDVYGFRMSCMKKEVTKEASIEVVLPEKCITKPAVVHSLDLYTCKTDNLEFSARFSLPVEKGGNLTALAGYFDTFFDMPSPVVLSTSPYEEATHWKQTVFYLPEMIAVNSGDVLEGHIQCMRDKGDLRSLRVYIQLCGKRYIYNLR